MTLTTHAVVGSLVGALAAHNLPLAATLGFVSHFAMDSIPHWDYHLSSTHEDHDNKLNSDMRVSDTKFAFDLLKIGIDVMLGLVVVKLLFYRSAWFLIIGAFIGALFAVLPDALQFVYWKFRHEPFISLQKFHIFMHAQTRLDKKPLLGVTSQIGILLVVAFTIKHFFP